MDDSRNAAAILRSLTLEEKVRSDVELRAEDELQQSTDKSTIQVSLLAGASFSQTIGIAAKGVPSVKVKRSAPNAGARPPTNTTCTKGIRRTQRRACAGH